MLNTNELTLAILAVLVILDIALLFMNGNAKKTKEQAEEIESTNRMRCANFIFWAGKLEKAVTQMRKRDENLLRELHKSMKENKDRHGIMLDKFSDADVKAENVAKKLRTVENVLGKCKNESESVKEGTIIILKEFKKVSSTVESLDKIIKKAETTRKRS